jgi:hypothetical protein
MKSKIGVFILLMCCQFCLGQVLTRKPLHGRVVNDSIAIENGLVFNVNAKTGSIIDQKGYFSVLVKVKDTLVISSLGFKSKKIILTERDISSSFFRVNLQAIARQLIEVVVHAKKGAKPEFGNTQSIVDTQYYDDKLSSPANTLMMPTGTGDNGVDCIRVYNMIFKNLRKNNPNKTDFVSDMSFTSVAMKSVSYSFFTNTLKLDDDQIGLFLLFCENDPKSKTFVETNEQFQIMDFLITKNDEYKKITTFEK